MSDSYNLVRKKKAENFNVVTKSTIEKLYPVGSVCKYTTPMTFEHGKWELFSTDGGVFVYKRMSESVYGYIGWLECKVGEDTVSEFLSYLSIEEETLDNILRRVLNFNLKDGDNIYIENSDIFVSYSLTENSGSHVATASMWVEQDITLTFNHKNGAEDIAHIYITLKGGTNGIDESVDIDYDKNFNYLVDKEDNPCNNTLQGATGKQLDDLLSFYGLMRQPLESDEDFKNRYKEWCNLNPNEEQRCLEDYSDWIIPPLEWSSDLQDSRENTIFNKTGENNMTTLQTVNVTLVDNNPNLHGEAKIVFKKHNHLTEYGVEDTKMNIISEGGVKEALIKHNTEVRLKTVDKDIQRSTGRDVMLEPIELLSDSDLEWRYVVIG